MKRFTLVALLAVFVLGCFASAHAATEVKMTGDVRIFGGFSSMRNWTGLNQTGTAKESKFAIWERFRLRTDFIANEALKFRLGIRVNNKAWGDQVAPGFALDNPSVQIDVYQAYLQFKWPDTDIQFSIGYQPLSLPQSSFFADSVVFEADGAAAAVIDTPLMGDTLGLKFGFVRLIDLYSRYFPARLANQNGTLYNYNSNLSSTRALNDTLDALFLALPIKVDGFKAIPWLTGALAGREVVVNSLGFYNTNLATLVNTSANGGIWWTGYGSSGATNSLLAGNLASLGTFMRPYMGRSIGFPAGGATTTAAAIYRYGMKNPWGLYGWAGLALELTYFDPIKFYADVIWGGGTWGRRPDNRGGWFIDAAVEYTGFDMVTPQVSGYWSSGEDKSFRNGSERMPIVLSSWNASSSFLFDGGYDLNPYAFMGVNPIGSWGLFFSLNKISFIEGLTHRITFNFANGTNSPTAIKQTNAALTNAYGSGTLFQMGRDLTTKEWVYGLEFDNKYMIYENLAAIVEAGWAHGSFQKGVWGRSYFPTTAPTPVNLRGTINEDLSRYAKQSDAFKVLFGLKYTF